MNKAYDCFFSFSWTVFFLSAILVGTNATRDRLILASTSRNQTATITHVAVSAHIPVMLPSSVAVATPESPKNHERLLIISSSKPRMKRKPILNVEKIKDIGPSAIEKHEERVNLFFLKQREERANQRNLAISQLTE